MTLDALTQERLNKNPKSVYELDHIFNRMTTFLNKIEVIKTISDMLNKYYRWICRNDNNYYKIISPKLNSQKFLSCYILSTFPEFSLSATSDDINARKSGIIFDMYVLSNELVKTIRDIGSIDLSKFVKSANNYSNAFTVFITKDKNERIDDLVVRWNDLEKTKSKVSTNGKYSLNQKESVVNYLEEQQKITEDFIQKIDSKFNTKNLKQIGTIAVQIEETMEKCYWNALEDDITQESGNSQMLVRSLNEIKDDLIMLHKKSKTELDNFFDVDFIIQKLNHDTLTFDDFISLASYLVQKVIYLQAPIRNDETKEIWMMIKDKSLVDIQSVKDDESYRKCYASSVTNVIKFILQQIQIIKDDIKNLNFLNT